MRLLTLVALLAVPAAASAQDKAYLSISAQGGLMVTYSAFSTRTELGPAFLLSGFFTGAYRFTPTLAAGGTAGFLFAPIGARIRNRPPPQDSDTTLGAGAGIFVGPNLSVFLTDRVVLENAIGWALLGAPGLYGGMGPTFNEALAFRFGGTDKWKYGFDVRALLTLPSIWFDSRGFATIFAVTAGFTIALM
ncbi:MAG: hypothetical protein JNK82_03925 [Myxococcaceae bacterium]|nr:hypothetical protein [Myxococcaceae bacterium]